MPRGLVVSQFVEDIATFARRAESLGYGSLWTTELWGEASFVTLTQAALRTKEIALGTAIVNCYSRSPATLAQSAATLDAAANGRHRLGIGPSTPQAIENLHGLTFDNPARRLHETVELTKQYLHGDGRIDYDGEIFDVYGFQALDVDVPVYTAALGPATRRATGRTADGWLPHNIPFEKLAEAFEVVAEAAESAGRDPRGIKVMPYVPGVVSGDPEVAVEAITGHLAYYIGSAKAYQMAVATMFPDEAEAIAEAWRAGNREAARTSVTKEMVEALGVAGRPAEAREQLESIINIDIVDEPLLIVPTNTTEEVAMETVEALAP